MSDERTDGTVAASRRILVIANETVAGAALQQAIRFRARHGSAEVLVVVPALPGRIRRVAPDARDGAEERLARSLERLRRAGVHVTGRLGDADPLRAIEDALGVFAADEVLVATHPEARSRWLAADLVARARSRFDVPVLHVVVHRGDGGGGPGGGSRRRFAPPITTGPTLSAS